MIRSASGHPLLAPNRSSLIHSTAFVNMLVMLCASFVLPSCPILP